MTAHDPWQQSIENFIESYTDLVQKKHSTLQHVWPLISGFNAQIMDNHEWSVIYYKHTGERILKSCTPLGDLQPQLMGGINLVDETIEKCRTALEKTFDVKPKDAIVILKSNNADQNYNECERLLKKHEFEMSLFPKKIFLSHKSEDKTKVNDFKRTLELLGFAPWLDEDAMPAGENLNRAILAGMKESCAAVFFIPEQFEDKGFLATEIDYAISRKRESGDDFAIITLV